MSPSLLWTFRGKFFPAKGFGPIEKKNSEKSISFHNYNNHKETIKSSKEERRLKNQGIKNKIKNVGTKPNP